MINEETPQQIRERICRQYNTGLFVIVPPEPLKRELDTLIATHDPALFSIVAAHVTISNPLREHLTDTSVQVVAEALCRIRSFTATVGPVRTFKENTVVYLAVEPQDRIKALRESLHKTGLFEKATPHGYDFVPHLTISEYGCKTNDEVAAMAEKLQRQDPGGSFDCHELQLIAPDDSCRFVVRRSFRLGKD
jgi:2'-5' RNA ligase